MSSAVKEILYDIWEEEMEEAEARGKEIGMQETLYSLVHDGLLPVASGAARANLTEAAFMENMKKLYSPETGG